MENLHLHDNIEKIHTTPMGAERVRKNLGLNGDITKWCIWAVAKTSDITRKGKNLYADTGEAVITINAHSFTIITAHKKK